MFELFTKFPDDVDIKDNGLSVFFFGRKVGSLSQPYNMATMVEVW